MACRTLVALGSLALLACTDRPSQTTEDGGSSSSSSTAAPTTGEGGTAAIDPTTSGGTTTPASGTTAATSGDPPGTTTGDPPGTTTNDPPGTTTGGTTGAPDTDGEGSSSGETTGGESGLVLDPATLEFFWLPINSIRAAVGGFDPATDSCVTIVFQFGGHAESLEEHCAITPMDSFYPYVIVTPDSAPPCLQWDYGGQTPDSAVGCMHVTSEDPVVIDIDMTLELSDGPFIGTISVASN